MNDLTIRVPQEDGHRQNGLGLLAEARAMTVTNKESHAIALSTLKVCASLQKEIVEAFREPKRLAHEAHKSITTLEANLLRPVYDARASITGKITGYEAEERRRAEEEALKLAEVARARAEELKINEAVAAEASGDVALAAEILNERVEAPHVEIRPEIAKEDGVSRRTIWSATVEDKAALVGYVSLHPEWLGLLEPNQTALNGLARSQRDALRIPGVRVKSEVSLATRV